MSENAYKKMREVNVNAHTEKKNNLTYLSWAWAVDVLLQNDPAATWHYDEPVHYGETVMVFCTVTAFGKSMKMQLPVMDHRNKCIPNPDAFAVNTAMQRCLAKAIALHGIGLYIYAGEDLPDVAPEPEKLIGEAELGQILDMVNATATDLTKLCTVYKVGALELLPLAKFAHVMAALNAKRKKQDERAQA